jgi:hypothetical protein
MIAQVVPFIYADRARILSFLTLEELRALATERRSMNRLLETFEIALEGNPGKHSGVSRALFDSLDEIMSYLDSINTAKDTSKLSRWVFFSNIG